MFKIITILAIFGAGLLAIATIILVRLNYNQDVQAKIISGLLIGVATVFITVYFPLTETKIEKVFTTSIVIDEQEHLPIFVIPHNSSQRVNDRLSKIYNLSNPSIGSGSETKLIIQKPNNFGETIRFLQELIQYKLISDLADVQRVIWSISSDNTSEGTRTRANFNQPVKPSDLGKLEGKEVLKILADNQFSKGQLEIWKWGNGDLPVPQSTKLTIEHIPSSEKTGVEKHKVILIKPNYFKIEMIIEPMVGSGTGVLPEGLVIDHEIAKRSQTYHFSVTMMAVFDRITSGSPKTIEYKRWAEWLFDVIERVNSDRV
mgnify:FL=1